MSQFTAGIPQKGITIHVVPDTTGLPQEYHTVLPHNTTSMIQVYHRTTTHQLPHPLQKCAVVIPHKITTGIYDRNSRALVFVWVFSDVTTRHLPQDNYHRITVQDNYHLGLPQARYHRISHYHRNTTHYHRNTTQQYLILPHGYHVALPYTVSRVATCSLVN